MPDEVAGPVEADGAVRHVFVYGTLRRGGSNDIARYRPVPQFVGVGRIAGTLYDLGAYPGALLAGASQGGGRRAVHGGLIHGEIYRITGAVEAALDVLEEVRDDGSGEYVKREIDVALADAIEALEAIEADGAVGAAEADESAESVDRIRAGARTLRCLVYEIHPSRISERIVIESGDWFRRH